MNNAKPLAPCPFCHSAPAESLRYALNGTAYKRMIPMHRALIRALIYCPNCGAQAGEIEREVVKPADLDVVIIDARKRWNVRDRRNAAHYSEALAAGAVTPPATVPEVVERNEGGFWTHSAFFTPSYDREFAEKGEFEAWLYENGLDYKLSFAVDVLEDIQCDDPRLATWEPERPDGDGWFIGSIHDTEDGPVCVWLCAGVDVY